MGVNTDREVQAQKTRRAAGPEGSEGACRTHGGSCPVLQPVLQLWPLLERVLVVTPEDLLVIHLPSVFE